MKQTIRLITAVFLMSLTGIAFASADAAAGKEKSAACSGCHMPDGNSVVPTFPKLAGQGAKYIAKQLADFKANTTRQNPVMLGMVAALSEQDMADLGAWFASQKLAGAAPYDESKLALGQEIFKGGVLATGVPACQGCHGPTGAGNAPAGYPQIGGQYTDYTINQLKAFKDGSRSNDDRQVMRMAVASLSDDEIIAVANYIASLK
jgi:cytochrome c553